MYLETNANPGNLQWSEEKQDWVEIEGPLWMHLTQPLLPPKSTFIAPETNYTEARILKETFKGVFSGWEQEYQQTPPSPEDYFSN